MEKVLVTGCSSGFGLDTCLLLAQNGFQVVATVRPTSDTRCLQAAISQHRLEERIQIEWLDLDELLQDDQPVMTLLEKYQGFDIVVFNAGILLQGELDQMTSQDIIRLIQTDLTAQCLLASHVIKGMKERQKGKLIFLSSLAGRRGLPSLAVYNASKYGIEGLAETLYLELATTQIEVYALEPGYYKTELWSHFQTEKPENYKKMQKNGFFCLRQRDRKEVSFQILKICQNKTKKLHQTFGLSGWIQVKCKPFIYSRFGKTVYKHLIFAQNRFQKL